MYFFVVLGLFWPYLHGKQRLGQDSIGIPRFDPWRGFLPTRRAFLQVLSRAREHVLTQEIGNASMDVAPHLYMYAMATRKFSWDSGAPAVIFYRNPSPWAPMIYPTSHLRTSIDQCTFFWFRCV